MKSMVLPRFGAEFQPEERAVPEPGPGEVRVKVIGVGAGLTLEHARQGMMGGETPLIMGHEFSGTVDAVGPEGVADWTEGVPVTASFYLLCGHCRWCASGREMLCTRMRGFLGTASDGAFAEHVVVPAHSLVRIPDGVEVAHAGIVADAIATPYHAVRERIRLAPGQRVAVVGAGGGLGVHALQVVRAFGGVAVAVERDEGKSAELRDRGLADVVVHVDDQDWSEEVRAAAGGEIDAVVDTVGSTATLAGGMACLGRAGTLVALGFTAGAQCAVDPVRLITEEVTVTGTRYATRAEIAETLELVRQGRVEPVIGASFRLSELNAAFAAIQRSEVMGRILIDVALD